MWSEDEGVDEEEGHPFWQPSHAKLQFAGNIGLLSLGGGWSWFERSLDLDLLFGWVPPLDGGEAIFTSTLKVTVWPLELDLGKRWQLRPISAGGVISYTFGDEYFVFQPDRYPDGYYYFSTAVRFGGFVGGSVGRRLTGPVPKEIDLYWEVGFTDLELYLVVQNPRTLSVFNALHLGLGVIVSF